MRHVAAYNIVTRSRMLVFISVLSFLALLLYAGVRVFYIVDGRVGEQENTSVAYSWVVLAAEVAIAGLGFYCRMLTRRSDLRFRELGPEELRERIAVRRLSPISRLSISQLKLVLAFL